MKYFLTWEEYTSAYLPQPAPKKIVLLPPMKLRMNWVCAFAGAFGFVCSFLFFLNGSVGWGVFYIVVAVANSSRAVET